MARSYYYAGRQVVLGEHEELEVIKIRGEAFDGLESLSNIEEETGAPTPFLELPNENRVIVEKATSDTAIAAMGIEAENYYIEPLYTIGDLNIVVPNRLIVSLKPDVDDAWGVLEQQGLVVLKKYYENDYLVSLPEEANAFEAAESLRSLEQVEMVEPDLITITRLFPDPPIPPGEDEEIKQVSPVTIKAVDAWELQSGNPEIRIAILDTKVDMEHEDLKAALIHPFDPTTDASRQRFVTLGQNFHGTAAAGMAAAIPNNGLGIRGIGGGCSIIPVRICFYPDTGMTHFAVLEHNWIISAIEWAWQKGADVITCAWQCGPSDMIEKTFRQAHEIGRKGKGCVIVAAAGNGGGGVTAVRFPGSIDFVLTVSGCNQKGEFKTLDSSDGESWLSCFGPEVDVAAPGTGDWSTDISGEGGANRLGPNNNYYRSFNGTSASTPLVAGAAGLILSANSDLRGDEVKNIICETAKPRPGDVGRNDQMGHGMIDVLDAVRKALSMKKPAPVAGPSTPALP